MSDQPETPLKHLLLAEALATFALVLVGCGAIIVDQQTQSLGHASVSAAFGLIVLAMIYSVGNISGAHLNPAVTIGFWLARRFPAKRVAPYVIAQLAGAVLAGLLLKIGFPEASYLGQTHYDGAVLQAVGVEIVITFLLMFIILNVSTGHHEKGMMAGVAIGGAVAMLALVAGPLTGASMNPARSFGPAIAAMDVAQLWLYFLAPVLGAAAAAPLCRWVQGPQCCDGDDDE